MAEMKIIVQKIDRIESHDNADRLAIAFTDILDWPIIVGKDSFKPGNKVVHFPVDCVVDDKMEDLLLGKSKLKLSKGRVRAAKIRGVTSYGILCPWGKIKSEYPKAKEGSKDLMKDLGCHKFEPPIKTSTTKTGEKTKKRQNRNFSKYFNMNHLQNCKGIFDDEDKVIVTEKLHGTSFRAGFEKKDITGIFGKIKRFVLKSLGLNKDWEFVYGSRNVQLQTNKFDKSVYKQMVEKYHLKARLLHGMVIYGEIVGPGIQKNYEYTEEPELFVYDIKLDGEYVNYSLKQRFIDGLRVKGVPYLWSGRWGDIKDNLNDLLRGGSTFKNTLIEGVVVEAATEEIGKFGRKKVKIINPEYLLNKDNTDFH